MSKTYKEIADEIGLDLVNMEPPPQKKLYYAYHEGKVVTCNSLPEAKKYKLYETVLDPDSLGAVQAHWESRNKLETQAAQIFKDELRKEYAGMSDELYNLCYKAAQDRSKSSSDYEEIPDNMKYFVLFAQKAINTVVPQPEQAEEEIVVDESEQPANPSDGDQLQLGQENQEEST